MWVTGKNSHSLKQITAAAGGKLEKELWGKSMCKKYNNFFKNSVYLNLEVAWYIWGQAEKCYQSGVNLTHFTVINIQMCIQEGHTSRTCNICLLPLTFSKKRDSVPTPCLLASAKDWSFKPSSFGFFCYQKKRKAMKNKRGVQQAGTTWLSITHECQLPDATMCFPLKERWPFWRKSLLKHVLQVDLLNVNK